MWRSTRWATSIWCGSALIAFASSVISRSKPGRGRSVPLTPQLVPGAVGRGRLEPFRERLEGVLVYRPDVLGWRVGSGQNGWRLRIDTQRGRGPQYTSYQ